MAWNETTQEVEEVRIDGVDDELLIDVYYEANTSPAGIDRALRDDNHVPMGLGQEETSEDLNALRCNSESLLLVELTP